MQGNLTNRISETDFNYIVNWLWDEKQVKGHSFYCNKTVIEELYKKSNLLVYKINGLAEGFIAFTHSKRIVTYEIMCLNMKFRHMGYGTKMILDSFKYFSKRGVVLIEGEYVTNEGRCIMMKHGFKKNVLTQYKENNFYKNLIQVRSQCNKANDLLCFYNKEPWMCDEQTKPYAKYNLNFDTNSKAILIICNPDWKVAYFHKNQLVKEGKIKYLLSKYNFGSCRLHYGLLVYINKKIASDIMDEITKFRGL